MQHFCCFTSFSFFLYKLRIETFLSHFWVAYNCLVLVLLERMAICCREPYNKTTKKQRKSTNSIFRLEKTISNCLFAYKWNSKKLIISLNNGLALLPLHIALDFWNMFHGPDFEKNGNSLLVKKELRSVLIPIHSTAKEGNQPNLIYKRFNCS